MFIVMILAFWSRLQDSRFIKVSYDRESAIWNFDGNVFCYGFDMISSHEKIMQTDGLVDCRTDILLVAGSKLHDPPHTSKSL